MAGGKNLPPDVVHIEFCIQQKKKPREPKPRRWHEIGAIFAAESRGSTLKNTFFEFIKRDLTLGIALTTLVFASALMIGGPFLTTNPPAESAAVSAAPAATQPTTLRGTVTRNGRLVYLNDDAGNVYQLDNVHHARALEGKYVTVTGELNSQTRLIFVERIEPPAA